MSELNNATVKMVADALAGGHYGQTWQDLAASRVIGTTYTNTTGKPIAVAVSFRSTNGSARLLAYVSDFVVADSYTVATNTDTSAFFIVPDGATYYASSNPGTLVAWSELR